MEILQAIPVDEETGDWNRAAGLLEQAVRAGNRDPAAAYLLGMCYKRLGRNAEARAALARIVEPDANVYLQRGLLAYSEKEFGQAEGEFARAWELAPAMYAAGYNLLLARLCQKKKEDSAALISKLLALAPNPGEHRFLSLLNALLLTGSGPSLDREVQQAVSAMSVDDEARLVEMLGGLGQFEVLFPLLQLLVKLRPHSLFAFQAYVQAILAQGKELLDRNQWEEAYGLLVPLTRTNEPHADKLDNYWRIALYNMLGTCSCMIQDFERGTWFFRSALEVFQKELQTAQTPQRKQKQFNGQGVFQQAWLEQNLALAYEWLGKLDKAEGHWNRYFDYLEYRPDGARPSDYLQNLAFEGLNRLADLFSRKEKWHTALGFLQRAHKTRPTDPDILERLFHLYDQLRKPEEARKILRRLRELRPNDPQVELFELDVREVRDVEDLDRFLADLRRVLQKHSTNLQVEERASTMVANLLPFMDRLLEQWSTQIAKVLEQMRRLPSYQINWPVVREVMRDLEDKFLQLRKSASKMQTMARPEVRRDLQKLVTHCDRKIEQCHSLGE
jgi:tetratricopeptide (TPR) repeat protein